MGSSALFKERKDQWGDADEVTKYTSAGVKCARLLYMLLPQHVVNTRRVRDDESVALYTLALHVREILLKGKPDYYLYVDILARIYL